jgi:hypothetical protein
MGLRNQVPVEMPSLNTSKPGLHSTENNVSSGIRIAVKRCTRDEGVQIVCMISRGDVATAEARDLKYR